MRLPDAAVASRASLAARMDAAVPAMLADIETLVRCESPSADLDAVARSADVVARVGTGRLGVPPERITIEGRSHLRWRFGAGPTRVLLLGHHDTVWPLGSLQSHPYGVVDGVLRGPGCVDMKAGLALAFAAVAALSDRAGLTLLVTGDEEVGSPSSRALIEEEARGCSAVLVLEAAAEHGALKTERKGVSMYSVQVAGRAAHAGLNPGAGVNASVELAHQLLVVAELGNPARGTTVTPTVTAAGTAANTVPASGTFAVDVRVPDEGEQVRVDAAMRSLRPVLPGARITVTGGPNRPPLEAVSSAALFDRAATVAGELGLPTPLRAAVGGGSDGNFTAGVGAPTLDGLGAVGGGAHADDEHVLVAELGARASLVAALVADVLQTPGSSGATKRSAPSGAARP